MAKSLMVAIRQQSVPDRLRVISRWLDDHGENETTRFNISTVLLIIADELDPTKSERSAPPPTPGDGASTHNL